MIYTVTSTLTAKAAVEGLITQAGQAGNSREASPPAAFVSGRGSGIRASATAGRAERRASAATGGASRVCGAKGVSRCGGTIVTRPSFGALGAAPHVPTSGLTRNRQWRGMGSSCTKQRARVLCLACLDKVSAATRLTEFSFDMQQSGSKQDPHALAAAALVLAVALAPGRATTPGVDSHLDTAQWS